MNLFSFQALLNGPRLISGLIFSHLFSSCQSHLRSQQFPTRFRYSIFTRGQFWPSGIVVACVCLFVCVCVSVCQSVCPSLACPCHNSRPVSVRITRFGPRVQNNLVRYCFVEWSILILKVKFKVQVQIYHIFEFVHTITHHPFKLWSPNWDQRCNIHW